MIAQIKKFIDEVIVELKKVSWSTRQEVIDSTWIVLLSSAMLGIFIAIADYTLARILSMIIK